LDQHQYLESIPTFRQSAFDFTSDVFYKVDGGSISVKSMDVQNNGSGLVIVKDVTFSGPSTGGRPGHYYGANPGPSISPGPAYSGFSPIVPPNSTATINLVPSGYSGNPSNTFYPGRGVLMIVRMALPVNDTSTLPYATIRGTIGWENDPI
jgi:hypothetical protein